MNCARLNHNQNHIDDISGFLTVSKHFNFLFIYWKFIVEWHSLLLFKQVFFFNISVELQMQNFAPETGSEWSFYLVIWMKDWKPIIHSAGFFWIYENKQTNKSSYQVSVSLRMVEHPLPASPIWSYCSHLFHRLLVSLQHLYWWLSLPKAWLCFGNTWSVACYYLYLYHHELFPFYTC